MSEFLCIICSVCNYVRIPLYYFANVILSKIPLEKFFLFYSDIFYRIYKKCIYMMLYCIFTQ